MNQSTIFTILVLTIMILSCISISLKMSHPYSILKFQGQCNSKKNFAYTLQLDLYNLSDKEEKIRITNSLGSRVLDIIKTGIKGNCRQKLTNNEFVLEIYDKFYLAFEGIKSKNLEKQYGGENLAKNKYYIFPIVHSILLQSCFPENYLPFNVDYEPLSSDRDILFFSGKNEADFEFHISELAFVSANEDTKKLVLKKLAGAILKILLNSKEFAYVRYVYKFNLETDFDTNLVVMKFADSLYKLSCDWRFTHNMNLLHNLLNNKSKFFKKLKFYLTLHFTSLIRSIGR